MIEAAHNRINQMRRRVSCYAEFKLRNKMNQNIDTTLTIHATGYQVKAESPDEYAGVLRVD